jgi:hypothetical protein
MALKLIAKNIWEVCYKAMYGEFPMVLLVVVF